MKSTTIAVAETVGISGVKHKIRVPQIKSLETAIRVYYERIELRNADIREIFGSIGNDTMSGLKRAAKDRCV